MSLMRNSLVASGAIFACRLTGMAREIVYTSLFGATGVLDAFYTAFRIPNLLRDLFAEGALSQSYTSVASKTREAEGDAAAWELTNKVATQLSTLMVAIVTLGILFAGPIMEALYSGDHSVTDQLFATDLSRIMWPFIGFASLSALVMGALNMVGVFGLPMLASAAFNVTSIVLGLLIGWFIDPSFGPKALYGFACGVTLGGMAQIAVQLPKLRRTGFRWKPNFQWNDPKIKKIWGLMLPSVLASGVTQFTIFINTGFALNLQKGSVTALTTAFRLWQLPVGLFGVATGMVVLPAVSRMMVGDGRKEVAAHIAKGLRLVAFFAVPAFLILYILGTEFVSSVYQWGRFNQDAVPTPSACWATPEPRWCSPSSWPWKSAGFPSSPPPWRWPSASASTTTSCTCCIKMRRGWHSPPPWSPPSTSFSTSFTCAASSAAWTGRRWFPAS